MPTQFVKLFAFEFLLTADNGLVFVKGDRPFVLELDRWPLAFGDDGAGEPVHVEGEIVDASQKDVGRNRAVVHRVQQMFGLRFDQSGRSANLVKRLVLLRDIPSLFGAAGFVPAHFVHDVLPVAFGKVGVAVLQINLGDLQIHSPVACRLRSARL